jgi:hypothetical protein
MIFDSADNAMRDMLVKMGWKPAALPSMYYWIRPDGVRVTEEEAFRQLAKRETPSDRKTAKSTPRGGKRHGGKVDDVA